MRKFNLSLDDFCPHPRAGLNFESIRWCDRLIDSFPHIKINLFVPSSYYRLGEKTRCHLTSNRDWTNKADALFKGNYRINMHGVHHCRDAWPRKKNQPVSNNDEWQFITYEEAEDLIERMVSEFKSVGLSHVRTFRPPGWRISGAATRALIDNGFKIAGSKEYYNKYKNKIHNLSKHWVSYNWDLTGPCKATGDVVAYGHTSDWTNNYMNEERYVLLRDFLSKDEFTFRFIEEM